MSSNESLQFVATLDATQLRAGAESVTIQFKKIGESADQADEKIRKFSKADVAKLGASLTGLATSAFSTYKAFNDLNDMQIRVRQSALQVSKAQEEVNRLQKEGKTGTLDYQQAQERLGIALDRQKKITDDVNNAQIQFALNMTTMATATIPMSVKGIVDLVRNFGGLSNAFKLLEVGMSKWLLIATGVILAFEGIAHVIKYFTHGDIDITIEKLGGDLMGALQGNIEKSTTLSKTIPMVQGAYGDLGDTLTSVSDSYSSINSGMDTQNKKIKEQSTYLNDLNNMWGKALETQKSYYEVAKKIDNVNKFQLDFLEKLKKNDLTNPDNLNLNKIINGRFALDDDQAKELTDYLDSIRKEYSFKIITSMFDSMAERLKAGDLANAMRIQEGIQRLANDRNYHSMISPTLSRIASQVSRDFVNFIKFSNAGKFKLNSQIIASTYTGAGISRSFAESVINTGGVNTSVFKSASGLGGSNRVSIGGTSYSLTRSKGRSGGGHHNARNGLAGIASMRDQLASGIAGLGLDDLMYGYLNNIHGGNNPYNLEDSNNLLKVASQFFRLPLTGFSGLDTQAEINKQLLSEIRTRVNLINELSSYSVEGGYQESSDILANRLQSIKNQYTGYGNRLGLDLETVRKTILDPSTTNDIQNMLRFKDREQLEMNTV